MLIQLTSNTVKTVEHNGAFMEIPLDEILLVTDKLSGAWFFTIEMVDHMWFWNDVYYECNQDEAMIIRLSIPQYINKITE